MPGPYPDFDSEERDLMRRAGFDQLGCPSLDRMLAARAGVLEQDEATPILGHLERCRFCQALAAEFAQGESANPTAQNLRAIRTRMERQMDGRAQQALPWWRQWHFLAAVAGAAACVAVAVYVGQQPSKPAAEAPQTVAEIRNPQFYLPLTAPPVKLSLHAGITWRSGEEAAASQEAYLQELGVALAPYRAANYLEAAARLGPLARKYPQSAEAALYLGVSLLLVNQPEEARQALEKAASLRHESLRDEVQWFLSVAWERTGNTGKAAAGLKPLCEAQGPYRDSACSALRQLR
ncbi:MAG: hypothetical protein JNL62_02620 [Bryobacterales bacterium]|nr:hypothetical protein [Bryobacterales bacterium]